MTLDILATGATGIFAGAALYISVVEHPARLACGARLALAEWQPSYRRGTLMQVPLALLGSASSLALWLLQGGYGWLLGAVLLFSVIPFTLLAILPTNKRLESCFSGVLSADEARVLLHRWGRLHAVRTLFGLAAFVVFLVELANRG